jgi:hypothetical protein
LNDESEGPDSNRWWAPYLVVLLIAAAVGSLVLIFVAAHAEEIIRVLRAAGS